MVSNLQLSRVDGSRGMERRRAGRGAAERKKGVTLGRHTASTEASLLGLLEPRPPPSPPRSRSLSKASHQHGSARAFRDPIAVLFLTLDLNELGGPISWTSCRRRRVLFGTRPFEAKKVARQQDKRFYYQESDRPLDGGSISFHHGVMPFETAKSKTTTTRATRKGQKEKAAEIRPMDNVQRPDAKRQGMGDHDVEVDPAG